MPDPEFVTPPGVTLSVGTPWRKPPRCEASNHSSFQQALVRDIGSSIPIQAAGSRLEPKLNIVHQDAEQRDLQRATPWGHAPSREQVLTAPSTQAPERDITRMALPWAETGRRMSADTAAPFLVMTPWKDRSHAERLRSSAVYAPLWRREDRLPRPLAIIQRGIANIDLARLHRPWRAGHLVIGLPPWEWARNTIQPKDALQRAGHGEAPDRDIHHRVPWGPSGYRDTTIDVVYPTEPPPVGDTIIIPALRIYIVTNSASIVRVSDARDVPASAVTLSISADTYSWDLSATLAGSAARALVEGTDGEPVEVDVTINGIAWRVLIDGWRLTEAWRANGGVVRGRSRAAYLAPPYASTRDYVESGSLLAEQLAAQELPFGWDLDWALPSWTVPAGAWQYQGLSPIDAIARLAAAAGGYIQAHRTDDTIHALPNYFAPPWEWAGEIPDFEIPRNFILQRSSDKRPGQGVNGVYVHGGAVGGILARVLRTGTAGDVLASTIVDALITDTAPARARGIAAIAATARQATEVHELPLSAEYGGLIETGDLVSIGEFVSGDFVGQWRGLVRAVSISAAAARARSGGVSLTVRQRIEIERHFEED